MKTFFMALLLLCVSVGSLLAQSRNISGTVTGKTDGIPIPGVSVFVKGTTVGTITMPDGTYSLSVPEESEIIVFSFVGMIAQEVSIGDQQVINVALEDESIGVEEVVVTAYGSKGKVGLKGAISNVSAKELDQVPVATFDQMLQGKTTGLSIASGSGQPGSSSTKVRIRGNSSIMGNNEPLYIMDGVPIEAGVFATLNANDFASISVLKDASATSIYGSRASNGVILITSKRGSEGKTTVNYRYQSGWSYKTQDKFDMMNSSEKLWFEELAKKGPGWDLSPLNPNNQGLSSSLLAAHEQELNRLRGIDTNWSDEFFRTGKTQSHEVNLSGGTAKTKFYMSFQNFDQEGIANRSDLKRKVGRLNLDHAITDKIRVGVSTNGGYSKSNRINSENNTSLANPFAAVYLANPWEEPYDANGNPMPGGEYKYPSNDERNNANGNDYQNFDMPGVNALDLQRYSTNVSEETKANVAAYAEIDIIDGLTFKTQYGFDYRVSTYESWVSPEAWSSIKIKRDNPDDPSRDGWISEAYRRNFEATFTNTLDYKKQIGEKHIVGALLGSEYVNNKYNGFGFTAYGLDPKLPQTPAASSPGNIENNFIPLTNGFKTERALYSLFSIFNYTYNERYTLTGSLRRDGSSAFGANNKFAILYSIGGIWDIKRESFMDGATWVNNLKLRASYGTTGNQGGIGNFEAMTLWGNTYYNGETGYGLAQAGDPDIKWEIGQKFNVGIDYNLFSNRLNGAFEVYNNITSDLFIYQNFSHTSGIQGKNVNAGKMRNRGVEALINYDIIRNNKWLWSIGVNLSYNENEILDLGQVNEFEQGTSIVRVGLPLNSHYYVKWAGVNPVNGEPLYYTKDGDVTNNFNANDAVAEFGTSEAPFTGGFNTSVSYKGIELRAEFAFAHGYSRSNNQIFFQENPNFAQYNMSRKMLDIWQQPGDITDIQAIGTERQFSSKDVHDASFLRFRNMTVAYNLPTHILKKTGFIQALRVYGQGQNLFVWTDWTGFDPEDNNNIAQYEYPSSRTFTVGLDITF
ncbi:SusC/RagA family TonB-linked outer membrane protein [Carboxylicivirga sp. N1Y90]|uniref:SusC/RagA family TonB-linked outer membrane protein n=1 Tax=Carboxylicivirga fragile TaxID=3417571 RepID=UPI003D344EC7|nr:SusC/RagA family TonB-linked outer membrane protein [Marinilabiliaceae bacterium N1Y90]